MRVLRIIGYTAFFFVTFLLFLYWMFPYGVLKDRLIADIEQQLGGDVDVSIGKLTPYYFSGVRVEKLAISTHGSNQSFPMLKVDDARGRLSILSVLVGMPRLGFSLRMNKGKIKGSARRGEEILDLDVDLNDVDLSALQMLMSKLGLNVGSQIDGSLQLKLDQKRMIRSSGEVELEIKELQMAESHVPFGGTTMTLPAVSFSKGNKSKLKASLGSGAISVNEWTMVGGDVGLDLKGKVFLSPEISNYRLNLNGSFSVSEKMVQALPFLFIVEKQKQADGTYPISITGRLEKPTVKIGTFTLPL